MLIVVGDIPASNSIFLFFFSSLVNFSCFFMASSYYFTVAVSRKIIYFSFNVNFT
jgi:hypothetical protein